MSRVTIILEDTPVGGVSVHSDYVPALGSKTSPAQAAAQDIINRTCKEYGLPNPARSVSPVLRGGIDIDQVHRSRDNVVGTATLANDLSGYKLKPGIALVLSGAQGTGKNRIAQEIAEAHGTFEVVMADRLARGGYLTNVLRVALSKKPTTLIIEGTPTKEDRIAIKSLLTAPSLNIQVPGANTYMDVPAPFVIVCTQDNAMVTSDDRRFDHHRLQNIVFLTGGGGGFLKPGTDDRRFALVETEPTAGAQQ